MLFFDLVLLAGSPCWCSRLVLQGGSPAGSPGWFSSLVFQAVSFGWVFRLVLPVGSPGLFSRLVALAGSPGWFSRLVLSVVSSCWFSRLVSPAGSPGWCSQLVLLFIFFGWELIFLIWKHAWSGQKQYTSSPGWFSLLIPPGCFSLLVFTVGRLFLDLETGPA